jgi:hypothetical protein
MCRVGEDRKSEAEKKIAANETSFVASITKYKSVFLKKFAMHASGQEVH